jgi:hypothetical protein
MSDDRFEPRVEWSLRERVRHQSPRPDVGRLIERADQRARRMRRAWGAAVVVALVAGVAVGWLWTSTDSSNAPAGSVASPPAAVGDGTSANTSMQPVDPTRANGEITTTFQTAFGGHVPLEQRLAAIQQGATLSASIEAATNLAVSNGHPTEQLTEASVTVGSISYIDPTHAIVPFSIATPHSPTPLIQTTGYAVFDAGRWKVSLRTGCDVLDVDRSAASCRT